MKKKTFERKLTLKKETLANLDNNQMSAVHGGTWDSCNYTCPYCATKKLEGTCRCPDPTVWDTCRMCQSVCDNPKLKPGFI